MKKEERDSITTLIVMLVGCFVLGAMVGGFFGHYQCEQDAAMGMIVVRDAIGSALNNSELPAIAARVCAAVQNQTYGGVVADETK